MSFLNLSREVRDYIYDYLLCPEDGVRLHLDVERCRRKKEAAENTTLNYFNSEEEDGDEEDRDEDGGFDRWRTSKLYASAAIPVPTAIFYTSRQLSQEDTEVFYGRNRFTFDHDIRMVHEFLKRLPPNSRRRIKAIRFTDDTTSAEDYSNRMHWDPHCVFITYRMCLDSVTIQVPLDSTHGIDESKETRPAPSGEWYWWPGPRNLVKLLMDSKIRKLRIGYSATLKNDNALENLEAVEYLRNPHSKEECDREHEEWVEFQDAVREGRSHKFASLHALRVDQEARQHRYNFLIAREDDSFGDIGTVIVLTRPMKS